MHDIHTHIGQFRNTYYDYHDVFKALKNNGITETTLAYLTPKIEDEKIALEFYYAVTEELKDAKSFAKEIDLKTNILYWADPLVFKTKNLNSIFSDFDYYGIAIHPTIHNWTKEFPDELTDIFKFAQEQNFPIYIHTGISEHEEPMQFEKWIHDFPQTKVHLAHCKDPNPIIHLFSKYKNLVGDTAFCPEDSYKAICDAGFKDRMFFGTDFPISHWYQHYGEKNFETDEKALTKSYADVLKADSFFAD